MRLFSKGALACAVLLSLAGCESGGKSTTDKPGGKSTTDKPGGAKYRIAVIPKGTTHEFWRAIHAGAAKAAKELGDTEIFWKGSQLESDREGQISVMQGFITKHVNGICLAPNDSQALVEYVDQAVQEKIPVVIFDSGLKDESKIVTYVATDNYKGGALAARRMGEVLHGEGNAILLRYFPGSESTERREQGFLETMQKEFPKIVILSSDQYSGTTPEESLTKGTQVLSKYKKDVNGLFAVCEPNASGCLGALAQTELDGKVCFIAFDPNAALIRGLEAKKVQGIVLQDPVKMGYEAVMSMHKHLQGEKVPKRIDTGSTVATPENMSEPRIQQLLKPDQFQD
jgi:ribose transport system substrate-binding protein